MGNIYQGAAIAGAAENIQRFTRERPERDMRRAEAESRRDVANLKLQEYKENTEGRKAKRDLELEQTKQQLASLQSQSAEKATYAAFDKYEESKDIKHLNNFLTDIKKNPTGAQMYQGITRIDKVVRTPETESQLAALGITDIDGYFENPDEHGNYVVVTDPTGKQQVIDLDNMYKQTRYMTYANDRALENITSRSKLQQMQKYNIPFGQMSGAERAARAISEETGETFASVLERLSKGKSGSSRLERIAQNYLDEGKASNYQEALRMAADDTGAGSAIERETRRVMQEHDISKQEAIPIAQKNIERRTTSARDVESARGVRTQMDEVAGGDFFSADLSDPKVRRKMSPLIAELEKFSDKKLSVKDRDRLYNIRSLMDLSERAGEELTDAETGFLDNTLHSMRKYMTDNVKGVKGTAAYATFRNVFRHALYGSALSQGEIDAFNESIGTLKQKKGPVLQELLGQMENIQNELQSVYDLNDQHLAYYYTGKTQEEMANVITQLQRRIDFISGYKVKDVKKTSTFTGTPEDKQSLLEQHLPSGGF